MAENIPVGIFAASSVVPKHEFDAGVERMKRVVKALAGERP